MEKTWCRQYGMYCKDKNCPYEHLDKAPESCNAILEFEDKKFVMCELDKNHVGNHQALMFEWEGKGISKTDDSNWLRGLQLIKMRMANIQKR